MKPYYQDEAVTIYHGDCREILPQLEDKVDLVLTDPPYGISKAEWDISFDISSLRHIDKLTGRLGLLCGVWNIIDCPRDIGELAYKWTLAAHMVNVQTRGGLGLGTWIPCIVYDEIYKKDVYEWCNAFADWCEDNGITKNDLNEITGTSDMGGWWLGKLKNRCAIPTPHQWSKIKYKYHPPEALDELVTPPNYKGIRDCKDFVITGKDNTLHPTTKPVAVITWFLQVLGGDTILDPFLGSGTTAYCSKKLNRKCIGIEIEEKYCEIAAQRCSQMVMELEV